MSKQWDVANSQTLVKWRQELVVVFARLLHEEIPPWDLYSIHVSSAVFLVSSSDILFSIFNQITMPPVNREPEKISRSKIRDSLWKPSFSSAMSNFGRVELQKSSNSGPHQLSSVLCCVVAQFVGGIQV